MGCVVEQICQRILRSTDPSVLPRPPRGPPAPPRSPRPGPPPTLRDCLILVRAIKGAVARGEFSGPENVPRAVASLEAQLKPGKLSPDALRMLHETLLEAHAAIDVRNARRSAAARAARSQVPTREGLAGPPSGCGRFLGGPRFPSKDASDKAARAEARRDAVWLLKAPEIRKRHYQVAGRALTANADPLQLKPRTRSAVMIPRRTPPAARSKAALPGPGEYDALGGLGTGRRGPRWRKPPAKSLPEPSDAPGPASYAIKESQTATRIRGGRFPPRPVAEVDPVDNRGFVASAPFGSWVVGGKFGPRPVADEVPVDNRDFISPAPFGSSAAGVKFGDPPVVQSARASRHLEGRGNTWLENMVAEGSKMRLAAAHDDAKRSDVFVPELTRAWR